MGFLNFALGEAIAMKKLQLRSVAFAFSLVAFAFLLMSGGCRLIGHQEGISPAKKEYVPLAGRICAAAVRGEEISFDSPQENIQRKAEAALPVSRANPCVSVCSDANGNVLGGESYLHAVYQAFSLGDGFV